MSIPLARRRLARPLVAVALVLAVLGAVPAIAGAHGSAGEMTLLAAERTDGGAVRLEVGLLYANDRDFAEEADVSATFTDGAGRSVGPVPLTHLEGARYGGEVDVPETDDAWTVAVTSTGPDAEATGPVADERVATTTTITSTTTTTTTTTTAPEVVAAAEPADGDADGGGTTLLLAVAAVAAVVVVAAAAAAAVVVRRRRGSPPAG